MAHPIADAKAAAEVAGAGAGEHRTTGQDAESTHGDARTTRDRGFDTQMTRENADVNVEERYALEGADRSSMTWLNAKRTFDLYQTFDADQIHASRSAARRSEAYENRASEQTLLHQAKLNSQEIAERQQDHAQRVRFADANSTIQIALLGDMAETLGEVHAMCSNFVAKG